MWKKEIWRHGWLERKVKKIKTEMGKWKLREKTWRVSGWSKERKECKIRLIASTYGVDFLLLFLAFYCKRMFFSLVSSLASLSHTLILLCGFSFLKIFLFIMNYK